MPWIPFHAEAGSNDSSASQTIRTPTLQELEHGIADRLKRVEEFKFIEQEASKLGVRAWLFGGTAAGYAHYVKWDMQREKGDPRFQKDRFDYDYTNIYRSTQDLDIVIDGNAEQAEALQSSLQEAYPHFQGSKTAWEVRLLTQDMGDKLAILNNSDFKNQHTDSNSTGLIEITEPKAGERVVRDVRDWNSKSPFFLKDIHEGKLHYYYSPIHFTTKFAREGRNPPILSVIRYLTKAFQYELELRPEDLENLKKVIHEFNPRRGASNPYVSNWIEKNGKKLIQNAVNIEYAWDTLEELGLRKKLISIKNNPDEENSLAWWMNKEPLRTKPLGKGFGKTAKALGIDVLAHETNNFLAYESITRAHTGDPNVLISRKGVVGEDAIFGNGFYVAPGRDGRSAQLASGLTIRFRLDPDAREGSDFLYIKKEFDGKQLVILNKAALKVIPEGLNIGPIEYFKMLAQDQIKFNHSDRGILERYSRRIQNKLNLISDSEARQIHDIVQSVVKKMRALQIEESLVLLEWIKNPVSEKFPELIHLLREKGVSDRWIASERLSQPIWKDHPELVVDLFEKTIEDELRINRYFHAEDMWRILRRIFFRSHWIDNADLVKSLIEVGSKSGRGQVSEKAKWANLSAAEMLSHPLWRTRSELPDLLERLIDNSNYGANGIIASQILNQPELKDHPELIEKMIGKADHLIYALAAPHWKDHPELVKKLIQVGMHHSSNDWHNIDYELLSLRHWKNHPELRRITGGLPPTYQRLKEGLEREAQGIKPDFSIRGCIYNFLKKKLPSEGGQ